MDQYPGQVAVLRYEDFFNHFEPIFQMCREYLSVFVGKETRARIC